MGAEVGRGGIVDGEMGKSRTTPRTRAGGVGNAVSAIVSVRPISLAFYGSGHSVAAEQYPDNQERMRTCSPGNLAPFLLTDKRRPRWMHVRSRVFG